MVKVFIIAAVAVVSAGTASGGFLASAPLSPKEKAQKLESVVCYSPKHVQRLVKHPQRLVLTVQITWNAWTGDCVYLASNNPFMRTSDTMDTFGSVGGNFWVIETGRLKSDPRTMYHYDEIPLSTD